MMIFTKKLFLSIVKKKINEFYDSSSAIGV